MYRSLNVDAAKIADKKFGQNFLKDSSIVDKIVEAMPKDGLPIVEIGPGLGDLTRQLIRVGYVRAYEVDKRLCDYLKSEFQEPIKSGRLELICKDVLESGESLYEGKYSLIANLPYYIATKIILNALHDKQCKTILVMVQKEVAQKFAAECGSKEFGSLAILAQSVADVEILFDVPPEAFVPPPKVTSAILSIKKRSSLEDRGFEEFLKVITQQPRKRAIKNLSTHYAKERVVELFTHLGLKPTLRPHEIELSKYHQLYKELIKDRGDESRTERETDTRESRDKTAAKKIAKSI